MPAEAATVQLGTRILRERSAGAPCRGSGAWSTEYGRQPPPDAMRPRGGAEGAKRAAEPRWPADASAVQLAGFDRSPGARRLLAHPRPSRRELRGPPIAPDAGPKSLPFSSHAGPKAADKTGGTAVFRCASKEQTKMEPPVIASASAGILIFSLIRNWLIRWAGRKDKRRA